MKSIYLMHFLTITFILLCLLTQRLPDNLWLSLRRACVDPLWKSSDLGQRRSCRPPRPKPHSASQRGLEATPGQIPLSPTDCQERHPCTTRWTGLAWRTAEQRLGRTASWLNANQMKIKQKWAAAFCTLTQWWEVDAGWSRIPEVGRVLDVDLKKSKQGRNEVSFLHKNQGHCHRLKPKGHHYSLYEKKMHNYILCKH